MEDAGPYECVAERPADGATRTSSITVSLIGIAAPEFAVVQPPEARVPAGIDVTFECGAAGK